MRRSCVSREQFATIPIPRPGSGCALVHRPHPPASLDRARLRAAAVAFLISLAAGLLAASPVCDGLRGLSLDLLTALRWRAFGNPHAPAASPAVVVAFDEETFRTPPFDGTPTVTWTREIAPVLTALIDGGAKVVGFDVVFPTSIEQSAVPFGDETHEPWAPACAASTAISSARSRSAPAPARWCSAQVQHQDKPLLPAPGQRAAVGFGRNIRALNVYSDPDDVARRVPLAFTVDGAPVARDGGRARRPRRPARRCRRRLATAGAVPGTITLNFAGGADDIPTYSFADLHACLAKDDTATSSAASSPARWC